MPKGIVSGLYENNGKILSGGNVYNFNLNIARGSIEDGKEINFETDDNGNVKVVFSSETNQNKKENSTTVDKRDLLTEEK
jgi:hypothetical protein